MPTLDAAYDRETRRVIRNREDFRIGQNMVGTHADHHPGLLTGESFRNYQQHRTAGDIEFVITSFGTPLAWYVTAVRDGAPLGWFITSFNDRGTVQKHRAAITMSFRYDRPFISSTLLAHNGPADFQQREHTMAATPATPVKSMGAIRAEVTAGNVEQIENWDDPRLYTLLTKLHAAADGQSWCAQFDDLAVKNGIPGRPKKEYFKITRLGEVVWGGTTYPVEGIVEVYGEVGDEAGAIADYRARYDEDFDVALQRAFQKNAINAITASITVTPVATPAVTPAAK